MVHFFARWAAAALVTLPTAALSQVTIGIDLSSTGPGAALGIQSANAIRMWPNTLGGQTARYIILDDASDVSQAVRNLRKLTSEEKVDALVGPNLTAAALAGLDVLLESGTPMVALAANAVIVEPQTDAKKRWAFKMPQNDTLMASALVEHMRANGIVRVGFIGFADSYGESWLKAFTGAAAGNPEIVATEWFQRNDASATGPVLKLMAARPDAVLIAASGTPAVLPQKNLIERGFAQPIYQTHGVGTLEFLQLGGKDVEGTRFPTGPGVVAHSLPSDNPVKQVALAFAERYEAQYGRNTLTQFAGDAWGAWQMLDGAVGRALKRAGKPGTPEFRAMLRDELENTHNLIVPNGVLNLSPDEHQGFDERARVMATVKNGVFVYAE